ncbi:hypothetical protein [Phytopseudomonas dryadis]|uniref:hypothetical protein n=1 Tax=Pseudomonadaceae TaxID=135621 RepID=UPI0010380216|nr:MULTISPECIES: hypothetical protein [Pseudomonas]
MNFSSWTPKERLISGAFFAVALACLVYGATSGIVLLSSEFFSMLAVTSLLIGLALTPSFMLKPFKESLGDNLQPPLRIAMGFFCGFQMIAIALYILA